MKKTITSFILCIGLLMSLFVPAYALEPGETTYTNSFSDETSLDDFSCYFLPNSADAPLGEMPDAHWKVSNGMVNRVNDINEEGATSNISVLVLKDYTFKNFELTVKYKDGTKNWGWAAIGFRQVTGAFFINDGTGVYIDHAGVPAQWGLAVAGGGPNEGTKIPSWTLGGIKEIKLRVVNESMTLYYNGEKVMERTMPAEFSYEGYISLQAVGNDCGFDNLSVTKLDDNGNATAIIPKIVTTPSSTPAASSQAPAASSKPTSSLASTASVADAESTASVASVADTNSASDEFEDEIFNEVTEKDTAGTPGWAYVLIVLFSLIILGGIGFGVFFILKNKKANGGVNE